jgi:serine/threonine-protein kinase
MVDSPDDDPELAEILDRYLQAIQSGQRADREPLLRAHPGWAGYFDCLDALEGMAPPSSLDGNAPPAADPPDDEGPFDGDRAPVANNALAGPSRPQDEVSPSDATITVAGAVVPRDFGPYELIDEIGRGGMGVVYRARQKGLDRFVAIKMVLSSHLASPEHIRRFHDEARAAASLRHSNIVPIHEIGQFHGQHFFAMEYIDGKSLAERLAEGALPRNTAVRIIAKVASAVDHLHRHGIVHRDLKPSNILLEADDEPFVSDFGLAKCLANDSQRTATGVIAGTPSYMAPEQASGHSSSSPACDIYSLGAILYEMLTRRPPFQEENPLDTLLQVLGSEPVPPRQIDRRVPRALELICLKCLARLPQDRYASAAALADDLDRYLKGEALTTRPPGVVQRLWSWARRQPALASRLTTLSAFYAVDVLNYSADRITLDFHLKMTFLIGVWIVGAIAFQQWFKTGRWSVSARFFWGALDSVLLLGVLLVADGLASPLVVGYFLLIVASGLWYRVRFVSYMTALQMVSYGVLMWDFYGRRTEAFRDLYNIAPDRHAIFLLAMVAMGIVVAYLVERVRALSAYFGHRI